MKIHVRLFGLGLLLLFGQPRLLSAQDVAKPPCQDVLHLRDGSILRGQIQAAKDDGKTYVFRTWSGVDMDISREQVKRIVQRCKDRSTRKYDFKETGWYHHTRTGLLIGKTYYGDNKASLQLQHSSGWMFSRLLGVGLGGGVELFDQSVNTPTTFPVFGEFRGYLLPQRVTPYFSVCGGWGFASKTSTGNNNWEVNESWQGGWMAQATVGYRIGNNFTVHGGFRLQQIKREWTSNWWNMNSGTDRILYKRLVLGVGLVL